MVGLLGLAASLVPSIVGLFSKQGGEVAQQVVDAGLALTGADSEPEAVDALNANPELLAAYKSKLLDIELEFYREDTKRMDIVNTTMRAEIAGNGIYKTGWRPAFGWVTAFSFGVVVLSYMGILGYTIVTSPAELAGVINALAVAIGSLVSLFAVALAVLGVSVWKRTDEKTLAMTGEQSTSSLAKVATSIRHALGKDGGK